MVAYYARQRQRNSNSDEALLYNALRELIHESRKSRSAKHVAPLTNAERLAASAAVVRSLEGVNRRRSVKTVTYKPCGR